MAAPVRNFSVCIRGACQLNTHEAQIGLVWDKSYIDEIIAGNTRDT
jgi:hypothetical protein